MRFKEIVTVYPIQSGVYGVVCTETGLIVYVGFSDDVGSVYYRITHCAHLNSEYVDAWLDITRSKGLKPSVVMLESSASYSDKYDNRLSKLSWIYELQETGQADFNDPVTVKSLLKLAKSIRIEKADAVARCKRQELWISATKGKP